MMPETPETPAWFPRFSRVDRFPTSVSALSALSQLTHLGVEAEDIRLVLEGRRRQAAPQILEQHPEPGDPVRHGAEVTLRLAADSVLDRFPERAFVSLPGREGREQMAAARRLGAPFDKARLLALARLRAWNAVFSGAQPSEEFERFLHQVLGLPETACDRARRVFDDDQRRAWLRILPLLPRFAGDTRATAEILAWFLGDPVTADGTGASIVDAPAGSGLRLSDPAAPPLGRGSLGRSTRDPGSRAAFTLGPLTFERAAAYAGLPFTPSFTPRGEQVLAVSLGPACGLDSLWESWAAERPELLETRWPLIAHILLHLVPAHLAVEVHLRPGSEPGWRLPASLGAWTRLAD